jgi:uncharacterized protein with PIN domain
MNELQFEVSSDTRVRLTHARSDAVIQGGDEDSAVIVLDGEQDQCAVRQEGDELAIESQVALSLTVPAAARVTVGSVEGDLIVRDMAGGVSVEHAHGEVLVRSCGGEVSFESAHGDVTVDQMAGPLEVSDVHGDVRLNQVSAAVALGTVHGNVRARALTGPLQIGTVTGDVQVRDSRGLVTLEEGIGDFRGIELLNGMRVHRVGGDVSLKTTLTPSCTYHARADGDIVARFPEESSARFVLEAGDSLQARLPEVEERSEGRLVGQSGDGAATVELSAGGALTVRVRGPGEARVPFGLDLGEDIAAQIESQIAETLGSIDIDELARHEIEKAMRKAEREIERARERAERSRERAEERLRRAQERAAEAARRAQERFRRSSRHWHGAVLAGSDLFGGGPVRRAGRRATGPKVSDEEQKAVLEMLRAGKITAEEAEKLLKALEG